MMEGSEDEIYCGKEYAELQEQIVAAEKRLLSIASEEVKKLYLEIDFLCCKQNDLVISALKKY